MVCIDKSNIPQVQNQELKLGMDPPDFAVDF